MEKVENSIAKEGNSHRFLHRIVLYLIKMIPIIIFGIYVLNTILSYFYIEVEFLSYIVQYLFIIFMYISSYAFKFCAWHRMFIHYLLLILTFNIIDYHWGIPLSNRGLLLMYVIITGLFLITIIYLKFKVCKH